MRQIRPQIKIDLEAASGQTPDQQWRNWGKDQAREAGQERLHTGAGQLLPPVPNLSSWKASEGAGTDFNNFVTT